MALPDLNGLDALALLRIADDRPGNAKLMVAQRILENKPLDMNRMLPEEVFWISHIVMTGGVIRSMLEDLTLADIVKVWASKNKAPKKRGPQGDLLYTIAFCVIQMGDQRPIEVYRNIVLPALIEMGRIQTNEEGEPDPHQDLIEQKNFLKAMARQRKKSHSP